MRVRNKYYEQVRLLDLGDKKTPISLTCHYECLCFTHKD